MKVAVAKAWWNARGVKGSGAAIRAAAFAYHRPPARLDSRPRTIAELTDDVVRRQFIGVFSRLRNLVKTIYHSFH